MRLAGTCDQTLSGLETVKIIVNAEKEAATLLEQSQAKALEIRKQVNDLVLKEREEKLSTARKEAALIMQKAKAEGKAEALQYEKQSKIRIEELIQKASSKKSIAVKALSDILVLR
jgi:F0F1-type ATP synthase membrane subunit b/b'